MRITISRAVARRVLGLDREIEVQLTQGGPRALPNSYRWHGPAAVAWARLECQALRIDVERERVIETPKRSYGRLGAGFEGYAACIQGGSVLVRRFTRCGRNDPRTQEVAAEMLLDVLHDQFDATRVGEVARRAA